MPDVTDVLYRLRDMAGIAADKLKKEIDEAMVTWQKLEDFANAAETSAELIAASDLNPSHRALIPPEAGLIRDDRPRARLLVETGGHPMGRVGILTEFNPAGATDTDGRWWLEFGSGANGTTGCWVRSDQIEAIVHEQ